MHMPYDNFPAIKAHILQLLSDGLSANLYYHGVHHVVDVLEQTEVIAAAEGITDEKKLYLLKIAALYHDAGFLITYEGHEDKSCEIARQHLPDFGMDHEDVIMICELIASTKIPQQASDILAKIICDADLDYLGREDFFSIADTLYNELRAYNILRSREEWYNVQITFLERHHYFTTTSIRKRREQKMLHLQQLKQLNVY